MVSFLLYLLYKGYSSFVVFIRLICHIFFPDNQYEASHSAYEQALHWLTEEQSSQSDLLVALGSMQYMFQGVDAAKTLLFQR